MATLNSHQHNAFEGLNIIQRSYIFDYLSAFIIPDVAFNNRSQHYYQPHPRTCVYRCATYRFIESITIPCFATYRSDTQLPSSFSITVPTRHSRCSRPVSLLFAVLWRSSPPTHTDQPLLSHISRNLDLNFYVSASILFSYLTITLSMILLLVLPFLSTYSSWLVGFLINPFPCLTDWLEFRFFL